MLVHGRHAADDAALIGPAGRASARLLAANTPGGAAMPADEADAAVEDIRRVVAENLERLRALRAQAADPEEQRRRMIAAAMVDETHGAQLRIRYEMAIERSMRSTIKQLMELERTGADLNEPIEADPPPGRSGPDREGEAPAEPVAPSTAHPGSAGASPSHGAATESSRQTLIRHQLRRRRVRSAPATPGRPGAGPTPGNGSVRTGSGPPGGPGKPDRRPEIHTRESQRRLPDPDRARSARRDRPRPIASPRPLRQTGRMTLPTPRGPTMRRPILLGLCLFLPALAASAGEFPRFEHVVLDPHVGNVCYAVTVADVDSDGRPDVVAVAEDAVYWYQNPKWDKHTIIKDATARDNVCIQPHDVDGDGRVDFALGASWQPTNTKTGGTLQILTRTGAKDGGWRVVPIGSEPTLHRLRWGDVLGTGKPQLVVAPLQGRDTKGARLGGGAGGPHPGLPRPRDAVPEAEPAATRWSRPSCTRRTTSRSSTSTAMMARARS